MPPYIGGSVDIAHRIPNEVATARVRSPSGLPVNWCSTFSVEKQFAVLQIDTSGVRLKTTPSPLRATDKRSAIKMIIRSEDYSGLRVRIHRPREERWE